MTKRSVTFRARESIVYAKQPALMPHLHAASRPSARPPPAGPHPSLGVDVSPLFVTDAARALGRAEVGIALDAIGGPSTGGVNMARLGGPVSSNFAKTNAPTVERIMSDAAASLRTRNPRADGSGETPTRVVRDSGRSNVAQTRAAAPPSGGARHRGGGARSTDRGSPRANRSVNTWWSASPSPPSRAAPVAGPGGGHQGMIASPRTAGSPNANGGGRVPERTPGGSAAGGSRTPGSSQQPHRLAGGGARGRTSIFDGDEGTDRPARHFSEEEDAAGTGGNWDAILARLSTTSKRLESAIERPRSSSPVSSSNAAGPGGDPSRSQARHSDSIALSPHFPRHWSPGEVGGEVPGGGSTGKQSGGGGSNEVELPVVTEANRRFSTGHAAFGRDIVRPTSPAAMIRRSHQKLWDGSAGEADGGSEKPEIAPGAGGSVLDQLGSSKTMERVDEETEADEGQIPVPSKFVEMNSKLKRLMRTSLIPGRPKWQLEKDQTEVTALVQAYYEELLKNFEGSTGMGSGVQGSGGNAAAGDAREAGVLPADFKTSPVAVGAEESKAPARTPTEQVSLSNPAPPLVKTWQPGYVDHIFARLEALETRVVKGGRIAASEAIDGVSSSADAAGDAASQPPGTPSANAAAALAKLGPTRAHTVSAAGHTPNPAIAAAPLTPAHATGGVGFTATFEESTDEAFRRALASAARIVDKVSVGTLEGRPPKVTETSEPASEAWAGTKLTGSSRGPLFQVGARSEERHFVESGSVGGASGAPRGDGSWPGAGNGVFRGQHGMDLAGTLGSPYAAAAEVTAATSEAFNIMAAERQRRDMNAMGMQETRRQERIANLKRLLVEMNSQ